VYGTAEDYDSVLKHPDLWQGRRGFKLIARLSERWCRHTLPRIRDEIVPGRTTLVAAPFAFGARIAAEVYDLPMVSIQLHPAGLNSVRQMPLLLPGWEWTARIKPWMRKSVYQLVWSYTDWLLAAPINACRAELGLGAPVRHIMRDYWHSPRRIVALFPKWFAPPQLDWPRQAVLTRFPLYDGVVPEKIDPEVEQFLALGAPPILFAPGAANVQAAQFFRVAAGIVESMNTRGIFISPLKAQAIPARSQRILVFERAPFGLLFPRCAAIVHRGGIGTTARALAAGVPQVIVAMTMDQPDNGARVRKLNAGDYLYEKSYTPEHGVARLKSLLTDPAVARACKDCQERLMNQISLEEVVALIEEVT
jgi:UDP:flavonoid glycosyltransferase YjiC (YdhE family)